jgi:hypothetical protein
MGIAEEREHPAQDAIKFGVIRRGFGERKEASTGRRPIDAAQTPVIIAFQHCVPDSVEDLDARTPVE